MVVDRRYTVTPISTHDEIYSLDADDSAFWTNEREYAEQLMATFETLWLGATKISKSSVEVIVEEQLSHRQELKKNPSVT